MKTAILTGFRAFGPYAVNPTEILARDLEGETIAGHVIRSLVFPTTIFNPGLTDSGLVVVQEAQWRDASVIISLGMASEARGARIEMRATNWAEGKYCTGFENRNPLFADRADHDEVLLQLGRWNLAGLSGRLFRSGIDLAVSEDAGTYACNAMMYRVMRAMKDLRVDIPYVFAHVPCTREAIAGIPDFDPQKVLLRQEDLVAVVTAILESYS